MMGRIVNIKTLEGFGYKYMVMVPRSHMRFILLDIPSSLRERSERKFLRVLLLARVDLEDLTM